MQQRDNSTGSLERTSVIYASGPIVNFFVVKETLSVEQIRAHIPLLADLVYLDSSAACPTPRPVVQAMTDYWTRNPFNYYGGSSGLAFYKASQRIAELCDRTRKDLAQFIGADKNEVVFTRNTTHGINVVAQGLPLKSGDEVIISDIEHQSNHVPWLSLRSKGIKVRIVSADNKGRINSRDVETALTERTRIISITAVSNIYGTVQPVAEIGRIAESRGIMFLVDAAQFVGRHPIDVKNLRCDFLVACGRKGLMGPQGIGFLYGKSSSLEQLEPYELGGGSASLTGIHDYELADIPHRFESGIQNAPGIIGLGRGVRYIADDIGLESISRNIRWLTKQLVRGLEAIPSVTVYGPKDPKLQPGIISFNVNGLDSGEVAARLDARSRIIVAAGTHGALHVMRKMGATGTIRASIYCYNNEDDISALLENIRIVAAAR